MPGIVDLATLLRTLAPVRNPGAYVFTSVAELAAIDATHIIALIREPEGFSLVMHEVNALRYNLPIMFRCAWITLTVTSDLQAVGLTAACARALSEVGISCNVIAGAYHDHIFVPLEAADQALGALQALQA